MQNTVCNNQMCLGSMMAQPGRNELRTPQEVLKHAKDFLDQYFTSIRR